MQTLHSHPSDETAEYIEEIRQLRQRVLVLESALANAEAAVKNQNPSVSTAPPITSINFTRPAADDIPSETTTAEATTTEADTDASAPSKQYCAESKSVFSESEAPAVVAVSPTAGSFAEAWNDDESFEERLAQRAFFEAGVIDEESRSWLLDT